MRQAFPCCDIIMNTQETPQLCIKPSIWTSYLRRTYYVGLGLEETPQLCIKPSIRTSYLRRTYYVGLGLEETPQLCIKPSIWTSYLMRTYYVGLGLEETPQLCIKPSIWTSYLRRTYYVGLGLEETPQLCIKPSIRTSYLRRTYYAFSPGAIHPCPNIDYRSTWQRAIMTSRGHVSLREVSQRRYVSWSLGHIITLAYQQAWQPISADFFKCVILIEVQFLF